MPKQRALLGLAALTALLLLPAAAGADRTGFITTRPTCSLPPKYAPDQFNYLQAPEPILLPSGDVTLLVGAGHCCSTTKKHWEALYSLTYPGEDTVGVPRFHPLWATNDFSRSPKRKEGEIGFPSALLVDGKWHIAFTTSFLPFHKPDRDRGSRLDLPNLFTQVTPAQVTNNWVQPVDPKCRKVAGCSGDGSGLDPVLTLHPNGDLFFYHRDGNYPACPSQYVRHRVGADLSVDSSHPAGCVLFDGRTAAPFLISDIARRDDGSMALLAGKQADLGAIEEWVSTGSPATIGLTWHRSGKSWRAPRHPDGLTYYVRDAAFLKDEHRTIVEPAAVVAQISDGATYEELVDVQRGRWYLYFWAEDGAPLPPSFGKTADACAFQGIQEAADCSAVRGWAWDPKFPTTPVSVDVLVDGVVAATVPANLPRPDLAATGKGDGRHGFSWTLPTAFRDGKKHKFSVRYHETTDGLKGTLPTLICP